MAEADTEIKAQWALNKGLGAVPLNNPSGRSRQFAGYGR